MKETDIKDEYRSQPGPRPRHEKTLAGLIESDFHHEKDLNCAEAILYGANEIYGLELPHSALKLAAGFGGGMGTETTCGVISGGVMALSALFVKDRGHEGDYIKELTSEYIEEFHRRMGSAECREVKETHRPPGGDCTAVILEGARILQAIIDRERRKQR